MWNPLPRKCFTCLVILMYKQYNFHVRSQKSHRWIDSRYILTIAIWRVPNEDFSPSILTLLECSSCQLEQRFWNSIYNVEFILEKFRTVPFRYLFVNGYQLFHVDGALWIHSKVDSNCWNSWTVCQSWRFDVTKLLIGYWASAGRPFSFVTVHNI